MSIGQYFVILDGIGSILDRACMPLYIMNDVEIWSGVSDP